MRLLTNEQKKERENFITEHLMELNKDNNTVVISVEDTNVYVSTEVGRTEGYIRMNLTDTQNGYTNQGYTTAQEYVIEYLVNDIIYKIILVGRGTIELRD